MMMSDKWLVPGDHFVLQKSQQQQQQQQKNSTDGQHIHD